MDGEKIIGLLSHAHPSCYGTMTIAEAKQRSSYIIYCITQLINTFVCLLVHVCEYGRKQWGYTGGRRVLFQS